MKVKKLTAGIVAAVMAVTAVGTPLCDSLPVSSDGTAVVAGAETYEDFEYKVLDDDTVEITKAGSSAIPTTIDGRKVTSIGRFAYWRVGFGELTIPDGITNIGFGAFYESSIKKLIIPESVKHIDELAFWNCKLLETVELPDSETSIDSTAFSGTPIINNQYTLDKYIGNWLITYRNDRSVSNLTVKDNTKYIADGAFKNSNLSSITIPDSVEEIGDAAFSNCSNLKKISISQSNGNFIIEDGILYNKQKTKLYYDITNRSKTTISVPDSVEVIGGGAFSGYQTLENIKLSDNVRKIGREAFYGCASLKGIVIPENVTYIDISTFEECAELSSVILPDSIVEIKDNAFKKCDSLETVSLPYGIKRIGEEAFNFCGSLCSINLPEGISEIGINAFANCYNLSEVQTPKSLDKISPGLFFNSGVRNVVISEGTTVIDGEAFGECVGLMRIVIPDSVTYIHDMAFSGCGSDEKDILLVCNVWSYARNNAYGDFEYAIPCNDNHTPCDEWTVEKPATCISDGVKKLYCKNCNELLKTEKIPQTGEHSYAEWIEVSAPTASEPGEQVRYCYVCGAQETKIVPAKGPSLITRTLSDKTVIITGYEGEPTDLVIPETINGQKVTIIDDYAFKGCKSLKSITMPDSIVSIGDLAFYECVSLEKINWSHKLRNVGDLAFYGCIKLKSIILPFSVVSIGNQVFFGCVDLFTITIPDSVTQIGNNAFDECSNLTISCNANSTAEQYAKKNKLTYKLTDNKPANISGFKVKSASSTSVTIQWTKNTSADGYIVEMYQNGNWSHIAKITSNSTTTFRKAGLAASTAYKFRVKAYKMSGKTAVYGAYSATVTARTNPSVIKGAKLTGRAADALRVNWTKNADASGYIVEMYQGNKWVRVAKITKNSTTTYRASGLKASTVYKFRVRAYKMEGKTAVYSEYSAELAARTNPSVITGAKLTGRAADALRINWTKNASADGYIIEMYQGNKWVRVAKITNNSTTTFRKAGLKASTVYKFRVRAYKMSGKTALYGNYSATVTARTNPSIVKGVKIAGKAKDALRVNWAKNASAQGYIVEMYKGGKWVRVAKITNGNTTTFRKAGLAKNTAYKFRVKAYHMSGKTALYGNYGSVSGKTAAK